MGLLSNKTSLNEWFDTVKDRATNSEFTLGSLVRDVKPKHFVARTQREKDVREAIMNGSVPSKYQSYASEDDESIKEDYHMSAYSAHLFQPLNEGACNCGKCPSCKKKAAKKLMEAGEGNGTGVGLGVGLGTPKSDANQLYNIPINQYQDSDASFVGDGESPETSRTNIPAVLAAKMAGGTPHPLTVNNGINRREGKAAFKLKPLKDDFGKNG